MLALAGLLTASACHRAAQSSNNADSTDQPVAAGIAKALVAGPAIPDTLGSACLFPTTHHLSLVRTDGRFIREEQTDRCDSGGDVASSIQHYRRNPDVLSSSVEVRGSAVIVHSTVRNPVSQAEAALDFSVVPGRPIEDGSAGADFGDVYVNGVPLRNRSDLRALSAMIRPPDWTGDASDGKRVIPDDQAAAEEAQAPITANDAM